MRREAVVTSREADVDERDELLRRREDSLEDHNIFIKHQMTSSMLKVEIKI